MRTSTSGLAAAVLDVDHYLVVIVDRLPRDKELRPLVLAAPILQPNIVVHLTTASTRLELRELRAISISPVALGLRPGLCRPAEMDSRDASLASANCC